MANPDPCCHDCTDFDDPTTDDAGCCSPAPTRRTCEAPALPVPECNEVDPIVAYDPETEIFSMLTVLYDSNCSALLDSNSDPLLSLIA